MSDKEQDVAPDSTAVRVALWRALHLEIDASPHILEDKVGLELAAPDNAWRDRPDMSPFTKPFRASILARARFIEDLVTEQAALGVGQYVILGAGLDHLRTAPPGAWRRICWCSRSIGQGRRTGSARVWVELGRGVPSFLRLVPVDFEAGDAWWNDFWRRVSMLQSRRSSSRPVSVCI